MSTQPRNVPRTNRSEFRSGVNEWRASPRLHLASAPRPKPPSRGDRFAAFAWRIHDSRAFAIVITVAFLAGFAAIVIGVWKP